MMSKLRQVLRPRHYKPTYDSDRLLRATTSAPVHGRLEGHVGVVKQPRRLSRPGWWMQEELVRQR